MHIASIIISFLFFTFTHWDCFSKVLKFQEDVENGIIMSNKLQMEYCENVNNHEVGHKNY